MVPPFEKWKGQKFGFNWRKKKKNSNSLLRESKHLSYCTYWIPRNEVIENRHSHQWLFITMTMTIGLILCYVAQGVHCMSTVRERESPGVLSWPTPWAVHTFFFLQCSVWRTREPLCHSGCNCHHRNKSLYVSVFES